mgnify:CR=1 FL=1
MKASEKTPGRTKPARNFWIDNAVTILFCVICAAEIAMAKQPFSYVLGEIVTRLFRNLILILALLVPVWAGMGLNFSIVLGAMAAQIGIIAVINFSLSGLASLAVAFLVSVPLSLLFGNLAGRLLNKTKGQEMITGMILGFFSKGIYDLVLMFLCGPVIPIRNESLLLTSGIGLTTPITLDRNTRSSINKLFQVSLDQAVLYGLSAVIAILAILAARALLAAGKSRAPQRRRRLWGLIISILAMGAYLAARSLSENFLFAMQTTALPIATGLIILLVCVYIAYLSRTKLGSDINAVGQNRAIAETMGIKVDKIRISAIMISTVLAALGQLIFIQEIGNFTTYSAHENVGTFAIAALLVGGASIKKASIGHAILGALLFHTMFIFSPLAGKNLFNDAQIGEYFRVFACYAVIATALALHAWKTSVSQKSAEAEEA